MLVSGLVKQFSLMTLRRTTCLYFRQIQAKPKINNQVASDSLHSKQSYNNCRLKLFNNKCSPKFSSNKHFLRNSPYLSQVNWLRSLYKKGLLFSTSLPWILVLVRLALWLTTTQSFRIRQQANNQIRIRSLWEAAWLKIKNLKNVSQRLFIRSSYKKTPHKKIFTFRMWIHRG
jgi:hypothetical protein